MFSGPSFIFIKILILNWSIMITSRDVIGYFLSYSLIVSLLCRNLRIHFQSKKLLHFGLRRFWKFLFWLITLLVAQTNILISTFQILPGYENIFMSHSSWFWYSSMSRIYKYYDFNIKDPRTFTRQIAFSSYPGRNNFVLINFIVCI